MTVASTLTPSISSPLFAYFFFYIATNHLTYCIYFPYLFSTIHLSPLKNKLKNGIDFCPLLYPQNLEQSTAHRKYSIINCWMNIWQEDIIHLLTKRYITMMHFVVRNVTTSQKNKGGTTETKKYLNEALFLSTHIKDYFPFRKIKLWYTTFS